MVLEDSAGVESSGLGVKPISPALAGRFLPTVPSGKSGSDFLKDHFYFSAGNA